MASGSSWRATYLPITSTSRLTASPGCTEAERRASQRLGDQADGERRRRRASTTVRLTPSTVIEPLSTRYGARSGGIETVTTSQCSPGSRRTTWPTASTWPWTRWPPRRVPAVTARSRLTRSPAARAPRPVLVEGLGHHVGGPRARRCARRRSGSSR